MARSCAHEVRASDVRCCGIPHDRGNGTRPQPTFCRVKSLAPSDVVVDVFCARTGITRTTFTVVIGYEPSVEGVGAHYQRHKRLAAGQTAHISHTTPVLRERRRKKACRVVIECVEVWEWLAGRRSARALPEVCPLAACGQSEMVPG